MSAENPHREAIIELVLNLVAPTVVLLFLSGEDTLGPVWGLVLALVFPVLHAGYTLVTARRVSGLALLAVVSVLLTGGIGLLELDVRWFAWKEMAFPAVLGVASVASVWTPWPVIPLMLDPLLDGEQVRERLAAAGQTEAWAQQQVRATGWIGVIFVGTAVATFLFARFMVVSPTGTEAFNSELGRYTALTFPILGIPSTVAMGWVLWRLLLGLEDKTGAALDDLLR